MLSGISASMKHVKSLQEIYHFIFYYFYNIIVLGGYKVSLCNPN